MGPQVGTFISRVVLRIIQAEIHVQRMYVCMCMCVPVCTCVGVNRGVSGMEDPGMCSSGT